MLNKARTDEENLVAKLEDQEKLLKDEGQNMDLKLTAALSSKVRALQAFLFSDRTTVWSFSGAVFDIIRGALHKARMITEIQELKRTLNGKDSVQQILFRNRNDQGWDPSTSKRFLSEYFIPIGQKSFNPFISINSRNIEKTN